MVLQEQGRKECLPTSVAMAANVPRRYVLQLYSSMDPRHRSFSEIYLGSNSGFWETSWRVLDYVLGPAAVLAYQKAVGWDGTTSRGGLWATGGKGRSLPMPKTGRGLLQLIHGRTRHTVAYEGGLVYDAEGPRPMTWREWKAVQKAEGASRWKIEGVIPTP